MYIQERHGTIKVLEGEKDEKGDYTLFERNGNKMQVKCSSNVEGQWSWTYWRDVFFHRHGYRIIFLQDECEARAARLGGQGQVPFISRT